MTIFLIDNFTEASDTPIESHDPDTGTAGSWAPGSNAQNDDFAVEASSDSLMLELDAIRIAINTTDPGDSYYNVTGVGKTGGTTSGDRFGIRARSDTNTSATRTAYEVVVRGSPGTVYLYRVISGSETLLDYYTISGFSGSTEYTLDLSVETVDASTVNLRVSVDSTLRINYNDTDAARITSTGYVGAYMDGLNARITYLRGQNSLSSSSVPVAMNSLTRRRR